MTEISALKPQVRGPSGKRVRISDLLHLDPVASEFGSFERAYYESGKRSHDRLDVASLDYLMTRLRGGGYRHLSLDVFDTLLIRNAKCERRRFWEIAERWKALLPHSARAVCQEDLYLARVRAAEIGYSCGPILSFTQEGRLDSLTKLTLSLTQLPPDLEAKFISAELEYEVENTAANPLILSLAAEHRKTGGNILLLSDMYMSSAEIFRILRQHKIEAVPDRMFSSADTTVNKRTGTIFGPVARALAAAPGDILHIGDSFHSDFAMPRARGWAAQHLPIPLQEESLRESDSRAFHEFASGALS